MDLLKDLNIEQQEVVTSTEGPLLVLAGAGSGKTKALTHRIAYLISEKGTNPNKILAITFTNKAAGEMKSRVDTLIKNSKLKTQNSPSMGTFHSVCARILRSEAPRLGYPQNFVIFDEDDAKKLLKQVINKLGLSDKKISPSTAKNLISSAKNELIGPKEYATYAESFREQSIIDVYELYQKELEKNEAMDFDDLLMNVVLIFQRFPEVLTKYQNRWQYLLIDEYQDTNHVQYLFAKLLAQRSSNICVVGDDWQCLLPGTKVQTATGEKKIETISRGDYVISASGFGDTHQFQVLGTKKFPYNKQIIKIVTEGGRVIKSTPNHLLFSRQVPSAGFVVYLMYSQKRGYRIGTAKNTRFDGRKNDTGLRVRANQERADRMWILKITSDRSEALYYEQLYSYQYGIPMLVFLSTKNRAMSISQKQIDKIYQNIDTRERAKKIFKDFDLLFEYPHYWPQATTRGGTSRININLTLFGDKRKSKQSPWSSSRISLSTYQSLNPGITQALNIRDHRDGQGSFRGEIHNLDYGSLEEVLAKFQFDSNEYNIIRGAYITENRFNFLPASQIHPGMVLPTYNQGKVQEEKVKNVSREEHKGFVYDLEIEKVHNYIASGVIVHNSIYSWRGANFQNILDFEKDWPQAKVVRLEKNYRSTKAILAAAQSVIERNERRSDKKIWTDNKAGKPIEVYEAGSEGDEASFVARQMENLAARGYKLSDMAVFYRTNAQSRAVEEAFLNMRLPYKIVGGVRFYERKEIKDALSWLRVASGANDFIALERSLTTPPSGIGKLTIAKIRDICDKQNIKISQLQNTNLSEILGPKAAYALADYFGKIQKIKSKASESLSAGVELAIKTSGLIQHLSDGTFENEERIENLRELLSVVKELEAVKEGLNLESFLEEVALISDLDNYSETDEGATLMTLHTSKGLEYKVVFIVGLEENIFPHSRSLFEPSELEEERRLFYVGMTRAKELLYLIHARRRLYFGGIQNNQPSRFIAEIPAHLLNFANVQSDKIAEDVAESRLPGAFQVGDTVEHEFFGKGTVLAVNEDEITADFNVYGKKIVSTEYAPIRKV
jgi:DNA helicase-2/ATP-dependent DNA helicase PcrA